MTKLLRAFSVPIGIAAGFGIYRLGLYLGLTDGGAGFLAIVTGVGTIIGVFFIDHW